VLRAEAEEVAALTAAIAVASTWLVNAAARRLRND